jgi:hypothetical protein
VNRKKVCSLIFDKLLQEKGELKSLRIENRALRQWERHFRLLFLKNTKLIIKFLLENIISVGLQDYFVYSSSVFRMLRACDNFKNEIESIQNKNLIKLHKNKTFLTKRFPLNSSTHKFIVCLSIKDLLLYLRVNGYYHKLKNKPVGNLKLVFYRDFIIIRFYVFLILSFFK